MKYEIMSEKLCLSSLKRNSFMKKKRTINITSVYQQLLELFPEIIFKTDSSAKLIYSNSAAFKAFGYSLDEFKRGISALQTVVPEDRARASENITRVMIGEKIGLNRYTALRREGTTFPVMRGGKIVGLIGVIIDITDLRNRTTKTF